MMGYFRSHQGVCDTPLHLFDENMDETVVDGWPGKVPSVSVEAFPVLTARYNYSCP